MTRATLWLIVLICLSLCGAEPAEKSADFPIYIEALSQLRTRWRDAAQAIADGKPDRAIALMQAGVPPSLDVPWRARHEDRAAQVARITSDHPGDLEMADFFMKMEQPELAIKAFEAVRAEKWNPAGVAIQPDVGVLHLAQCYIEVRRYSDARKAFQATPHDIGGGWDQLIAVWIDRLAKLKDGAAPEAVFLKDNYGWSGISWYADRIWLIETAWRADAGGGGRFINLELLRSISDHRNHKEELAWQRRILFAELAEPASRQQRTAALRDLADQELEEEHHEQAVADLQRIVQEFPGTSEWVSAQLKIAGVQQQQGRLDDAIHCYQALIDLQDRDGAFNAAKQNACWGLENCLLSQRKYAEALAAAERRADFPAVRVIGCGELAQLHAVQEALFQGICSEGVGDYTAAVKTYKELLGYNFARSQSPIIARRIARLYAVAGQLGSLVPFCKGHPGPNSSADAMRSLVALYYLEKAMDWGRLIERLAMIQASPEDVPSASPESCESLVVMEILAHHPQDAVPLLKRELAERRAVLGVCCALGRCGTTESISLLKKEATTPGGDFKSALEGLRLAGSAGDVALKELANDPDAGEPLRTAILALHQPARPDPVDLPKTFRFPPVPRNIKIPSDF